MPILAYKIALLALSQEIQHSSLERRLSSGALFFVKNDVDSGSRSRPILLLEMIFLLNTLPLDHLGEGLMMHSSVERRLECSGKCITAPAKVG